MEIPDKEKYIQFLNQGFTEASQEIEKIVKNNEISGLLDGFLDNLRARLLKERKSELSHGISEIERIRSEIAHNANPRLALESLYLILKDV
jgi:vacuolar-type H+-ATPase subunit H